MSSTDKKNTQKNTRLGFHYFPDTNHYRETDMQTWVPVLQDMGASWLVLESPIDRAIPEYFITGIIQGGIEPIIRMKLPLGSYYDPDEIKPLLAAYARWGVNGIIFFDKPNSHSSWTTTGWIQQDLVAQFLDQFTPLANAALQCGLIPILPPLEPGGSFWDTTFLRSTMDMLVTRGETEILNKLAISAYPWTYTHSLNWGAGGPDRWPLAKPYFTPISEEDQRGFRIFDWYIAITQAVLGRSCPIFLLEGGIPTCPDHYDPETLTDSESAQINISIIKLLNEQNVIDPANQQELLEDIPPEVVSCNLWLLSADPNCPYYRHAWFKEIDSNTELIQVVRDWAKEPVDDDHDQKQEEEAPQPNDSGLPDTSIKNLETTLPQLIDHYLLLPTYEWGVADWHLDVIRPYIKKHKPTIGFSIEEAALSKSVTVVGNTQSFPEGILERLRLSGCEVERITGDGTKIATELAER